MEKINLAVVVTEDRKIVLGLTANAPMEAVCLALISQGVPDAPRLDIRIMTEAELDEVKAGPSKPAKAAPMASLRERGVCPVTIKGGEVGAMLSILSDNFVNKGK